MLSSYIFTISAAWPRDIIASENTWHIRSVLPPECPLPQRIRTFMDMRGRYTFLGFLYEIVRYDL